MAGGTSVGRNDPCPCGSGRKYKRCCLVAERIVPPEELVRRRLRGAEDRIVSELLRWATRCFGTELLDLAWHDWWCGEDAPEPSPEWLDREPAFVSWMLFRWIVCAGDDLPSVPPSGRRAALPETPLGLAYLAAAGRRLDPFERRFVAAACERPFAFYAVTAVAPGSWLDLRDLLTGRELRVLEQSGSESLLRGDVVFAQILELDGVAIFLASGTTALPPERTSDVLDLRDRHAKARAPLDEKQVRELDRELRRLYQRIREMLHRPLSDRVRNTDGDELVMIRIRYRLACTPREAFDRLASLAVMHEPEDLLEDATFDAAGELVQVSFVWEKRGNRMNRSWDNTVMSHLTIDGQSLEVSVNSEKRSRSVRKQIERRLGPRARFEIALHESIDKLLEAHADEPPEDLVEREELERTPEVREMIREMARRHWDAWVDEEIPALGGLTPRQAAQTPGGRERLEALFLQYERHQADPRALPVDLRELRHRIGL